MKYIGTKIIEAEPSMGAYYNLKANKEVSEMGYKVIYEDGYMSWSPKDVFEKAYLPLIENPYMSTDAPSISQEMVDDFIKEVEVMTMGEKTTVVRAVLRNGFEIVESSACVSKENYDEKLGVAICINRIKNKVWELLGFLLQTAVHGIK